MKLGSLLSSRFIPAGDPAVSVVWKMAEVSKWRRSKNSASRGGRGGGDDDDDAKESRSRFTLKHLVYNFWTFVACDPRDKVFAYHGLLNLYAAEWHRADHGMGLAAIYTAAARGPHPERGVSGRLVELRLPALPEERPVVLGAARLQRRGGEPCPTQLLRGQGAGVRPAVVTALVMVVLGGIRLWGPRMSVV